MNQSKLKVATREFRGAGLTSFELELAAQLYEQADERGIPIEDIPALARNLDRIDWDEILMRVNDAARIIGVDPRQVGNLIEADFEWIAPTIWLHNNRGSTVSRLWLAAKVRTYAKLRASRQDPRVLGWLKRKSRDDLTR